MRWQIQRRNLREVDLHRGPVVFCARQQISSSHSAKSSQTLTICLVMLYCSRLTFAGVFGVMDIIVGKVFLRGSITTISLTPPFDPGSISDAQPSSLELTSHQLVAHNHLVQHHHCKEHPCQSHHGIRESALHLEQVYNQQDHAHPCRNCHLQ